MLSTSPLDKFLSSLRSIMLRAETGATPAQERVNDIANDAAEARDRIRSKSTGDDADLLQNALIDIWSAIYGVFDNGPAATAVENLKTLRTKPDITTQQRGAEIALFLRLYCSEKHVGKFLGVLVAKGALTEVTLVTALEKLRKTPLPADFHTQSRTAQKRILLQFIHPLLMTCIAASVGTNPLQLPPRYLDTVTSWVEATCKEEPLPSDAGNGAAAGAGEPLAATVVDRSALPALNPPEVTLAWEELSGAYSIGKVASALDALQISQERHGLETNSTKYALACLKYKATHMPRLIGSSPFDKLSSILSLWSQYGTTEKLGHITKQLNTFKTDKSGDIHVKWAICDFVKSSEFGPFHLTKLLAACAIIQKLTDTQILKAIKDIAQSQDIAAMAIKLIDSLTKPLIAYCNNSLPFWQYSENAHKKGETPMSEADYASL